MSGLLMNRAQLQILVKGVQQGAANFPDPPSKASSDGAYALAYNLYAAGNYQDAQVVFQSLCVYCSNDARYWTGLGACRQALQQYPLAVDAYQMAAVIAELKNPDPMLRAAGCLIEMGEKDEAKQALELTLSIGDKQDPKVSECHERAQALLALLA
ncbi:MAG: SycD/LcrH family type III secretion system chaperone [Duodenibacillus sp.]|nr:SycD/LcrH family type III secretion system chaperone [Duodenibacillus sp.]